MGITRKPNITDHWKQKFGLFRTQVNTIMSRDRFQLIWRYLHFYDSELPQLGQPDKLLKLRWFVEYLNKAFHKCIQLMDQSLLIKLLKCGEI